MSMDIFNKALENIDENYPFSMSPKLILALLIVTGLCTIIIGIVFIWYKRKTSLTTSAIGNLHNLIPSLKEKIPTLDSLLPILAERALPQNAKNALTSVAVPHQPQPSPVESMIQPVLMPKLSTTKPQPVVPYRAAPMEPLPSTSTTSEYQSEPISLEMFNCAVADLNDKGVINIKSIRNISINLDINFHKMNPHQLLGLTGPANNFAMGGLPMQFANILIADGKQVPQTLFMDIMVEKTQILIEHVNNHHLGLCLTANIGNNSAVVCVYDNFATVNTQMLQVTISNMPNLETQLFQLYVEVTAILHDLMLEEDDEMPPLEGLTDDESDTDLVS